MCFSWIELNWIEKNLIKWLNIVLNRLNENGANNCVYEWQNKGIGNAA